MTPDTTSSRSSIRPLPFASFHTNPLNDTDAAIDDGISDNGASLTGTDGSLVVGFALGLLVDGVSLGDNVGSLV